MLTCGAAVALARWERHVLQPAAQDRFGVPVVRIEHLGSYACRRISVLGDWQAAAAPAAPSAAEADPKAAFLRQVRDGACQGFAAVLGPDYNAAHRDHFHLDRGPYRACR